MSRMYADVIVDITSEQVDRTFQYRIPDDLQERIAVGAMVLVPFGKGERVIKAYVVRLSDTPDYDVHKLKEIREMPEGSPGIEARLIALADWMHRTYGSTMIQALKTVLPLKQRVAERSRRRIRLLIGSEEGSRLLEECEKKNRKARARLLKRLLAEGTLDYSTARRELKLTRSVLAPLEEQGVLKLEEEQIYRLPAIPDFATEGEPSLSVQQQQVLAGIRRERQRMPLRPCLLHGITGSGKTRVYMELIDEVLREGRQAIVLIPEIALTYQMVWRFRSRFGQQAAVIHSRMSQGERWDAFRQAQQGTVRVMIGPRSALFTPFPDLGLIIVDEEHETSYKSEGAPRYHARETAAERGRLEGAQVIMGSATPSLEAYERCRRGIYALFTLRERFGAGGLPRVHTVDMREELRRGNTTMLSQALQAAITERLAKREQVILFLNRRAYAGFLSCRSCGHVEKCPHCDVSLALHRGGRLMCHYCGYTKPETSACPKCGSHFIGAFRAGTQQVEEAVKQRFPEAAVLRMDLDTTRKKDGYAQILEAFAAGEADILIGTQMIIKGHDFPGVTLVGALAADLSLYAQDYRCGERTFQLLVQAVGRAGRGERPGEAYIQTYHPEHYSICAAAAQDYEAFFEEEMAYRTLMDYPPACAMLSILGSGRDREQLRMAMNFIRKYIETVAGDPSLGIIGPADAAVARIQDQYRVVLYLKHPGTTVLQQLREKTERYMEINPGFRNLWIQFDLQV